MDTDDEVAKYDYLWNGSNPGWVLLKAPDLAGGYCVFHKSNHVVLLIESSRVNDAVCRKMQEAGCEVLEQLPPGGHATVSPA